MPIPFSLIPEHIQLSIVQKQDIHDYAKFCESSRDSHNIGSKVRTRFVLEGEDFEIERDHKDPLDVKLYFKYLEKKIDIDFLTCPVRIVAEYIQIWESLSEELYRTLMNFLLRTGSSFNNFILNEVIQCTAQQFNNLVKVTKVNGILFEDVSIEFLLVPAMKRIYHLIVFRNVLNATEEQLLSLKNPRQLFYNATISNFGINSIIEEWLVGTRCIDAICFFMPFPSQRIIFDRIPNCILKSDSNKKKCVIEINENDRITVKLRNEEVFIYNSSNAFKLKYGD